MLWNFFASEPRHGSGACRVEAGMPVKRFLWMFLLLLSSVALFPIAISRRAYTVTSLNLRNHIPLRKTYALGAFSLLGFLLQRVALPGLRSIVSVSAAVGLYSAAIEVGQVRIARAKPGRRAQAYDILSGLVAGALGYRVGEVWEQWASGRAADRDSSARALPEPRHISAVPGEATPRMNETREGAASAR